MRQPMNAPTVRKPRGYWLASRVLTERRLVAWVEDRQPASDSECRGFRCGGYYVLGSFVIVAVITASSAGIVGCVKSYNAGRESMVDCLRSRGATWVYVDRYDYTDTSKTAQIRYTVHGVDVRYVALTFADGRVLDGNQVLCTVPS